MNRFRKDNTDFDVVDGENYSSINFQKGREIILEGSMSRKWIKGNNRS